MNAETKTAVRSVENKMKETEQQIAEAKRIAASIPVLFQRLESLRKTRALLIGDHTELASLESAGEAASKGEPRPGSVGHRAISIVSAVQKPVSLRDIYNQLRAQGVEITEGSLSGILSTYAKKGWIVRTSVGFYSARRDRKENP
jgi:hypothetical protein